MAATTALNARKNAAASLKGVIDQVNRYKVKPNPSARLLKQKRDTVLEATEILKESHYTYAEKANKDPEEEELVEWLRERIDTAVDLSDELFLLIDDLEGVKKNDEEIVMKQEQIRKDKHVAQMQYESDETELKDRV